jgi:hypothetical protein
MDFTVGSSHPLAVCESGVIPGTLAESGCRRGFRSADKRQQSRCDFASLVALPVCIWGDHELYSRTLAAVATRMFPYTMRRGLCMADIGLCPRAAREVAVYRPTEPQDPLSLTRVLQGGGQFG